MNKPSAEKAGRRRRIPAAKRGRGLYRRTQERIASCGARRILAVLRESGPRKRNVLAGGDAGVVDALVVVGLVRKRGNRRHRRSAVYEAVAHD
jgi:type II secretory pathway component PulM